MGWRGCAGDLEHHLIPGGVCICAFPSSPRPLLTRKLYPCSVFCVSPLFMVNAFLTSSAFLVFLSPTAPSSAFTQSLVSVVSKCQWSECIKPVIFLRCKFDPVNHLFRAFRSKVQNPKKLMTGPSLSDPTFFSFELHYYENSHKS